MHIDILTLFPEMLDGYFTSSIMKRAIEKGIVTYKTTNFRSFAHDKHQKCDDVPFGGGAGLLLKPEPISQALESIDAKNKRVIYASPSGKRLTQEYSYELSKEKDLVFICGHYEGLDQRVIDEYVTDEICIGDYVITSGEISSLVIIDSVFRLIEGVISEESLEEESFSDGLLEYPQYTRPERYCQKNVPSILLSGHHAKIATWRVLSRLTKTMQSRPELLSTTSLTVESRKMLLKLIDMNKGIGQNGCDQAD